MPHVHDSRLALTADNTSVLFQCSCGVEVSRCYLCNRWTPTTENQLLIAPAGTFYYCATCTTNLPRCSACGTNLLSPPNTSTSGEPICHPCWESENPRCVDCNSRNQPQVNGRCGPCSAAAIIFLNPTFGRNPEHRKIGIELEFVTSDPHQTTPWGKIKDDGSVSTASDQPDLNVSWSGREFASKPLIGDQLVTCTTDITNQLLPNSYTNVTCGFHAHVDAHDITPLGRQRLMDWWLIYEPIFFGLVDKARVTNRYCRPARNATPYDWEESRYYAFNRTAYSKHRTIEFRLHHGTLNPDEILPWCRLLLAFVRTHKDIELLDTTKATLARMNHRQLLIVLFSQTGLPLSIRKAIVTRILTHNHRPRTRKHLRHFVGETLNLTKTPVTNDED